VVIIQAHDDFCVSVVQRDSKDLDEDFAGTRDEHWRICFEHQFFDAILGSLLLSDLRETMGDHFIPLNVPGRKSGKKPPSSMSKGKSPDRVTNT
jgi:hypothetical protein